MRPRVKRPMPACWLRAEVASIVMVASIGGECSRGEGGGQERANAKLKIKNAK